ncbi:hypothetical protein MHBO_002265 [Bonamia ostreae]|uniref:Protein kinase domain-containing protein n=1 Tax=Bonamia ostreae TaxID=126728 RepID=A0ABV2ALT1_9EUKA
MSNMGEPPELRINGIFGFFTDSWDLGVLLIYACCKVYPDGQNTEELLKFFRDNNKSYYYDQQFTPILKEKLLQTDYEKRLWGKELPKAADDAQLIKCFGKTKFEVLKINLHY